MDGHFTAAAHWEEVVIMLKSYISKANKNGQDNQSCFQSDQEGKDCYEKGKDDH